MLAKIIKDIIISSGISLIAELELVDYVLKIAMELHCYETGCKSATVIMYGCKAIVSQIAEWF